MIVDLGGTKKVGKLLGVRLGTVVSWTLSGFIPHRHHTPFLRICKNGGLDVSREELEAQYEQPKTI